MVATIHDLSTDLLELLCTHLTLADVDLLAWGSVHAVGRSACAKRSLAVVLPEAAVHARW